MKRIVAAAVVAAIVAPVLAAPPLWAQPRAQGGAQTSAQIADGHLHQGLARYDAGDFEAAITAFEAGYAVEPRPAFLFAAAQAARRAGDCQRAIDYYQRFLAGRPSASQADAARDQRDRCAAQLAAAGTTSATASAGDDHGDPAPSRSTPGAWYADRVTGVAVGGSTVLLVTGTLFLVAAGSATDDANRALTYDDHVAAADRASTRRTVGIVSLATGAALGAFAGWRIARHPRSERADRLGLRLGVGPGAGVVLGGHF